MTDDKKIISRRDFAKISAVLPDMAKVDLLIAAARKGRINDPELLGTAIEAMRIRGLDKEVEALESSMRLGTRQETQVPAVIPQGHMVKVEETGTEVALVEPPNLIMPFLRGPATEISVEELLSGRVKLRLTDEEISFINMLDRAADMQRRGEDPSNMLLLIRSIVEGKKGAKELEARIRFKIAEDMDLEQSALYWLKKSDASEAEIRDFIAKALKRFLVPASHELATPGPMFYYAFELAKQTGYPKVVETVKKIAELRIRQLARVGHYDAAAVIAGQVGDKENQRALNDAGQLLGSRSILELSYVNVNRDGSLKITHRGEDRSKQARIGQKKESD